jgi:hypothetical protein
LLDDELHGEAEDPNRQPVLCDPCAELDKEYWDDMWAEYNRNRY